MTAQLICGELRRSGDEVADRALRLAGGLARFGVEDGDVIAVMLRNGRRLSMPFRAARSLVVSTARLTGTSRLMRWRIC
ncbi:hypothetical protein ULG90_19985 [Halopseudomonas pachastrellae]|nr:hypothetical protein ULG90_19985 [Halopseudomonas pachastrellae]